jgi:ribose transport system permease protein
VAPHTEIEAQEPLATAWSGFRRALSVSKISGIYVWALIILVFSLTLPSLFPTLSTFQNIASSQSITAIITISLVFTLACGLYDLSIGYNISLTSIVTGEMLTHGHSIAIAVVAGLITSLVIGLANVAVVVGLGIDSFIATLAMGSVLEAVSVWLSQNQLLTNFPTSFSNIANRNVGDVPIIFVYLIVIAVAAWYILVHTPFGRRLYAVGKAPEAARLAGVKTRKYSAIALLCTAFVTGIAAVLMTSDLGSASASQGDSYLLPAFAAVFLGATQIHPGRPNVWGALIASFLLATGVTGLQLAGASTWVPDLFNGLALIVAVGLTIVRQRFVVMRMIRSRRRITLPSPEGTAPAKVG